MINYLPYTKASHTILQMERHKDSVPHTHVKITLTEENGIGVPITLAHIYADVSERFKVQLVSKAPWLASYTLQTFKVNTIIYFFEKKYYFYSPRMHQIGQTWQ